MKVRISVFSLMAILWASVAFAGWQYQGYYVDDGYYTDDGSRFTIGFRGGLSLAHAKMKNNIGDLDADYFRDTETNIVITALGAAHLGVNLDNPGPEYEYIGVGDVASLPVKKDFSKMVFTAGGSIGFTVPNHPQWRLEAAFDHIAETDYNQTPFLEGDLITSGSYSAHVFSSGVVSTVSTDIVSAMAFYDFFEGKQKQLNQFIPYVGFGVGYAMSKTTLQLTDVYGDLSKSDDLVNYGDLDVDSGVITFANPADNDAPVSSNIAVLGALGASYGISKYTFLDFNFRLMYVPKINWQLVNGSLHRDWFSAEDMIYTNFMIGLRFEF